MASIWPRAVIESNSDRLASCSGRSLIPRDNELPFRGNFAGANSFRSVPLPHCRRLAPRFIPKTVKFEVTEMSNEGIINP